VGGLRDEPGLGPFDPDSVSFLLLDPDRNQLRFSGSSSPRLDRDKRGTAGIDHPAFRLNAASSAGLRRVHP
jgi:hypothetical protein